MRLTSTSIQFIYQVSDEELEEFKDDEDKFQQRLDDIEEILKYDLYFNKEAYEGALYTLEDGRHCIVVNSVATFEDMVH